MCNERTKAEALDVLQGAITQVNAAMEAISKFAKEMGVEPKEEVAEKKTGVGSNELAQLVSERTGICPHIIEEALDTAMDILIEMSKENE